MRIAHLKFLLIEGEDLVNENLFPRTAKTWREGKMRRKKCVSDPGIRFVTTIRSILHSTVDLFFSFSIILSEEIAVNRGQFRSRG